MTVAVAIFAIALIAIASERLDRTKAALAGAALILFTQTIDQDQAVEAIDFNTIGLLAGMMILVRITEETGLYNYLAIRAGQLSGGRPLALVVSLSVATAVLSAFLDNLTTILLVVPITFLLADALDIDPIPLILIEVIASNIGGTATLIGDPPNILIAGATGLSFMEFIAHLAPVAAVRLPRGDGGAVSLFSLFAALARGRAAAADVAERTGLDQGSRRTEALASRSHRDDPALLRSQAAPPRTGDGRPRRGDGDAAAHEAIGREGPGRHRVADFVLLHGSLRHGRCT